MNKTSLLILLLASVMFGQAVPTAPVPTPTPTPTPTPAAPASSAPSPESIRKFQLSSTRYQELQSAISLSATPAQKKLLAKIQALQAAYTKSLSALDTQRVALITPDQKAKQAESEKLLGEAKDSRLEMIRACGGFEPAIQANPFDNTKAPTWTCGTVKAP